MKKTTLLPRVFNFSGGKTSAFMTLKYYQPGDLVIFCDTGREHPKTYKFINDFEAFEKIPVIRLKYENSENPFRHLLEKKKYKVIPNRVKRICTSELKIVTCKRYLRSIGIQSFENFIGFRHDEQRRLLKRVQKYKKVIDKFPLNEDKITKEHIDAYWQQKEYTLEIPSILGNCTLCFMKGKNAIIAILREHPELADEWIKDEDIAQANGKLGGHTYFPDTTIRELLNVSNQLKRDYDLTEIKPAFDCSCGT